jgi:two-component system response regulator FixJ
MFDARTVFVVDDEVLVLDTIRRLLGGAGHVVQCFDSAQKFLDQIQPDQTGCLITDLSMPEIDGFQLQQQLRGMNSMLSVIVVSGRADVNAAVRLMRNGVLTLLEKPYPTEQLLEAVNESLRLSLERADRHRQQFEALQLLKALDDDERAVIALAAEGMPNKAIAQRLALSPRTVDRRRKSALIKLNIPSPAGFTRLLSQAGQDGGSAESLR